MGKMQLEVMRLVNTELGFGKSLCNFKSLRENEIEEILSLQEKYYLALLRMGNEGK